MSSPAPQLSPAAGKRSWRQRVAGVPVRVAKLAPEAAGPGVLRRRAYCWELAKEAWRGFWLHFWGELRTACILAVVGGVVAVINSTPKEIALTVQNSVIIPAEAFGAYLVLAALFQLLAAPFRLHKRTHQRLNALEASDRQLDEVKGRQQLTVIAEAGATINIGTGDGPVIVHPAPESDDTANPGG